MSKPSHTELLYIQLLHLYRAMHVLLMYVLISQVYVAMAAKCNVCVRACVCVSRYSILLPTQACGAFGAFDVFRCRG